MIIESRDNKLIKYVKKLQDKKFAIKEGKTLVESPKLIQELYNLGMVEKVLLVDYAKDKINVTNDVWGRKWAVG